MSVVARRGFISNSANAHKGVPPFPGHLRGRLQRLLRIWPLELLIGPSHAKVARSRLNVLVYFNLRGQIIHCLGNVDATKHPHPWVCGMGLAHPKHHAATFIVRRWQRGTVSTSDRQLMGSIRRPITNGVDLRKPCYPPNPQSWHSKSASADLPAIFP